MRFPFRKTLWWLLWLPVWLYASAPEEIDLSVVSDQGTRSLLAKSIQSLEMHPDSALKYAVEAQEISREAGDDQGLARGAFLEGQANVAHGRYDAAREAYSLAGATYSIMEDTSGLSDCMLDLAALEIKLENYRMALENCRSALQLARSGLDSSRVFVLRGKVFQALGSYDLALDDLFAALAGYESASYLLGQGEALQAIGDVKFELNNLDEARKNYREALRLFQKSSEAKGEMESLCKLGLVELESGMEFAAIHSHRSSLELGREMHSARGIAGNHQFLGLIFLKLKEPDSALIHFNHAADIWRGSSVYRAEMVDALHGMALSHQQKNQLDSAMLFGTQAADTLAQMEGQLKLKAANHDLLAEVYQAQGKLAEALFHRNQWTAVQSALGEEDKKNKATELEVRFEYEEAVSKLEMDRAVQAAKLEQETEQRERDQVILAWLAGLIVLSIVFLFFLLRSNKKSREANRLLKERGAEVQEKNQALSAAQSELERHNANLESLVDERTEALKQAVESLIQVNEDLDTFIYRASHDLMGPIARLKGLSVLLKESGSDSADSHYLALIDGVTTYMHRVLEKTIQAHEMRSRTFQKEKVSLQELVDQILPKVRQIPGYKEPEITLNNQVAELVEVDPQLTTIVLENILENAVMFSQDKNEPARIKLDLSRVNGHLVIEAEDKGIGIPQSIRSEVFDIFFRGSERSKGNGLGLYMVKKAVDQMNGSVELDSEEGKYTRLRVEIPV